MITEFEQKVVTAGLVKWLRVWAQELQCLGSSLPCSSCGTAGKLLISLCLSFLTEKMWIVLAPTHGVAVKM